MTLRLKAATQPAVNWNICQFTPIQSMNCQIHYSRRTTISKFHTPRRDEFSSRLVLLSFLLLLLYKRGRKMIDRSQQMEVGISRNEARDKKRTHLNLWTAERNDTPPVPNVFQLHQLFFTLIRMSIRFSLFFWISSRLLLYTDLNVLWPLWPLLPTIFFLAKYIPFEEWSHYDQSTIAFRYLKAPTV